MIFFFIFHNNLLKLILMYLGLIPFCLWVLPILFKQNELWIFGDIYNIIKLYGLIILSFIFGIFWEKKDLNPIINNFTIISLMLFYLSLKENYFYILALGFMIVIIVELFYEDIQKIENRFDLSEHRKYLSIAVIINLLITKKFI
jgi:hypothetical protein